MPLTRAVVPAPIPAPIPTVVPTPVPIAPMAPTRPPMDSDPEWGAYLRAISGMGFERVVIISRKNLEMLAASNPRLDSKAQWRHRIEQQRVLNGRQKLLVLNWFRKLVLEGVNTFEWQSDWAFPPYILNLITLHYLENIDDKQQLKDDWRDNYKPCFYFFQQKWNILMRDGYDGEGYQSLVCLKRRECVIAFQSKKAWIIAMVRIERRRYRRTQFTSAPQAYSMLCQRVLDAVQEANM